MQIGVHLPFAVFQFGDQFVDGAGFGGGVVEPAIEQLEEDPLGPLIVLQVGGGEFAVPVVAEAETLELPFEGLDGVFRGHARMDVGLHGVLLRRQAKRVPADGVQDVEALHSLVARQNVRGSVAFRVPDVQPRTRCVRKHIQHVVLRLARIEAVIAGVADVEGLVLFPIGLPLGLNFGRFVLTLRLVAVHRALVLLLKGRAGHYSIESSSVSKLTMTANAKMCCVASACCGPTARTKRTPSARGLPISSLGKVMCHPPERYNPSSDRATPVVRLFPSPLNHSISISISSGASTKLPLPKPRTALIWAPSST